MDFKQYLPSIRAAILPVCVMLPPMSLSLSKIRVMTLHVAARTNILLVTWQEDLAPPQPPEQPRLEGEGAPAGEVSAATSPGPLGLTLPLPGLLASPWQNLPLATRGSRTAMQGAHHCSHFPELLDKNLICSCFCHFLILGIFHE